MSRSHGDPIMTDLHYYLEEEARQSRKDAWLWAERQRIIDEGEILPRDPVQWDDGRWYAEVVDEKGRTWADEVCDTKAEAEAGIVDMLDRVAMRIAKTNWNRWREP